MAEVLENAVYVLVGGFLGFLVRSLEARWAGAGAVQASLRACHDSIRRLFTDASSEIPVSKDLSQLEADCLRFREVLLANPRFGGEYWKLSRYLFGALRLIEGKDADGVKWCMRLLQILGPEIKKSRVILFLPGADSRLEGIADISENTSDSVERRA